MKYLIILLFVSCRSVHVVSPIDKEVQSVVEELSPDTVPDPVFRERVRRAIVDQQTEREQIKNQLGQKLSPPNFLDYIRWAVISAIFLITSVIAYRLLR
jgi:hypothetical protein